MASAEIGSDPAGELTAAVERELGRYPAKRVRYQLEVQVWYAQCGSRHPGQSDESFRGDDHRRRSGRRHRCRVMDTPRRARASISHRRYEEVTAAGYFVQSASGHRNGRAALVENPYVSDGAFPQSLLKALE